MFLPIALRSLSNSSANSTRTLSNNRNILSVASLFPRFDEFLESVEQMS